MDTCLIGIDVGGTSVKIGVFSRSGTLLENWSIPTVKTDAGNQIIPDIAASVREHLDGLGLEIEQVAGAGTGIPGFINHHKNEVFEAVNIGWKNVAVGDHLSELLGIPVWIENDANLAALGEYQHSRQGGPSSLLFVTLGTGVGGAVIVDGEIITGASGTAGEIGHTVVDRNSTFRCNCGRYGCLDTIASTSGIARLVGQLQDKYPLDPLPAAGVPFESQPGGAQGLPQPSDLPQPFGVQAPLDVATVFQLAKQGHPVALEVIDFVCDSLGYALASATMIVNPAQIIIGGGLSHYGEFFLDKVKHHFRHYVLARLADETTVRLARLGNRAGIVGAAAFAGLRAGLSAPTSAIG